MTDCILAIVATVVTKGKATIPMTVAKDRLRNRIGHITEQDMGRVETALKRSQGL